MNKLQTHKIPAWRRGVIADTILTFDCYNGRESVFFSRVACLILTHTTHQATKPEVNINWLRQSERENMNLGEQIDGKKISEELVKGLNINKHINILCEVP